MILSKKINLFLWSAILIGILPAAVSATISPTSWCLNIGFQNIAQILDTPPISCLGNTSIDSFFLKMPFSLLYLVAILVGIVTCIYKKRFIIAIALLPLFIVFALPISQLKVNPKFNLSSANFEDTRVLNEESIRTTISQKYPNIDLNEINLKKIINQVNIHGNERRENQTLVDDLEKKKRKINDRIKANNVILSKLKPPHYICENGVKFIVPGESCPPDNGYISTTRDNYFLAKELKKLKRKLSSPRKNLKIASNHYRESVVNLNKKIDEIISNSENSQIRKWTLIYSLTAFVALAIITMFNPLQSYVLVALILSTWLIGILQKTLKYQEFYFSNIILDVLYSLYPVILLIVTALFLRIVVVAIQQNKPLLEQIEIREFILYLGQTLLKWSVLGAFLILGLITSLLIDRKAEEAVYNIPCTKLYTGLGFCETDQKKFILRDKNHEKTLEENINLSVHRAFKLQEEKVESKLREMSTISSTSKDQIPAQIDNLFNEAFPEGKTLKNTVPALQYKNCKFWDIGCRIERHIKIAIVDAYDYTRSRQRAELQELTSELSQSADNETQSRIEVIQSKLTQTMGKIKSNVIDTITTIFWYNRSLNLLVNFILLIMVVKSLGYIFARLAFKKENGMTLPIDYSDSKNEALRTRVEPKITTTKNSKYRFKKNGYGSYYIKPRLNPKSNTQEPKIPQSRSAILRRLSSFTYMMLKINPQLESSAPEIDASSGNQFLEWELQEGEEVYFKLGSLAAFSETVTLQTKLTLSISALCFGRMVQIYAKGPGLLILKTYGKTTICAKNKTTAGTNPFRYIAWSKGAEFNIESTTSFMSIYFHTPQISFARGGAAAIDVSEEGYKGSGAIRFIPGLFLPV